MKAVRKKRITRRFIYSVIILFFVGVISVSAFRVINLVMEKAEAEEKLLMLEREKAQLEEELARVGSDEYIEQQAREQLNMIMPGETLYILKGNGENEGETDGERDSSGEDEEKDSNGKDKSKEDE